MRLGKLFARGVVAFALLCALTIGGFAFTQYNRTISVTGASPQRLSSVLSNAGYTAPDTLDELTICNPTAAANTLYLGQSDVSAANGFPLLAGDCKTERAVDPARPILAGQIYLFVASTQSVNFSIRSK